VFNDHLVQWAVLIALLMVVLALGFRAARWRQTSSVRGLEEWGLGGRSFGPVLTWFLVSGDLYTAYTFVALPALVYAVGAVGFFAVPFAAIVLPLGYLAVTRMWSVAHVHGLVTPADFVRVRFGSPALALMVGICGIVATLPYIALQLLGMDAVFKTLGVHGAWPLWVAFGIVAVFTYNAGLRAPALFAIVKDVLILIIVVAALLVVATRAGGWSRVFTSASARFSATPNATDGVLLGSHQMHVNYVTLALGSALAIFLYPHAVTGFLAAKNRATVQRTLLGLPIYTFALGIVALLGYVAIAEKVTPVGGDRNTIMPRLFDQVFPDWLAGSAYAALIIGAFVPAAIMSIAAANLFTRNIYKEFIRRGATPEEEARVSRIGSLAVKFGAVATIVFLPTQFSLDLQLIGGVIILQTLPSVAIGLFTSWMHRHAVVAGLVAGLAAGLVMLYQTPGRAADGTLMAHFGGSAWPLSNVGVGGGYAVYSGLVALVLNLLVAVIATPILRRGGDPDGHDITWRRDYFADETEVRRLDEILDGRAVEPASADTEIPAKHAARLAQGDLPTQRLPLVDASHSGDLLRDFVQLAQTEGHHDVHDPAGQRDHGHIHDQ
jgi:SSS family solute:Na+ symporter